MFELINDLDNLKKRRDYISELLNADDEKNGEIRKIINTSFAFAYVRICKLPLMILTEDQCTFYSNECENIKKD